MKVKVAARELVEEIKDQKFTEESLQYEKDVESSIFSQATHILIQSEKKLFLEKQKFGKSLPKGTEYDIDEYLNKSTVSKFVLDTIKKLKPLETPKIKSDDLSISNKPKWDDLYQYSCISSKSLLSLRKPYQKMSVDELFKLVRKAKHDETINLSMVNLEIGVRFFNQKRPEKALKHIQNGLLYLKSNQGRVKRAQSVLLHLLQEIHFELGYTKEESRVSGNDFIKGSEVAIQWLDINNWKKSALTELNDTFTFIRKFLGPVSDAEDKLVLQKRSLGKMGALHIHILETLLKKEKKQQKRDELLLDLGDLLVESNDPNKAIGVFKLYVRSHFNLFNETTPISKHIVLPFSLLVKRKPHREHVIPPLSKPPLDRTFDPDDDISSHIQRKIDSLNIKHRANLAVS